MTSITIKNIPIDLFERLRTVAAANRRSINSEIIVAIEDAVMSPRIDHDSMLATAERLRLLTADWPISEIELNELKNTGRP